MYLKPYLLKFKLLKKLKNQINWKKVRRYKFQLINEILFISYYKPT